MKHPPFEQGNKLGHKHGHSPAGPRSPTYNSWADMRSRCNNPNDPGYHNYGGRGITVCERWARFVNFLEDMGVRPSTKHSIERINNALSYEKSNCCWATRAAQAQNSRRTRFTWAEVRYIRKHGLTPKQIVAKYGVAVGTAYALYQGKTWKEN